MRERRETSARFRLGQPVTFLSRATQPTELICTRNFKKCRELHNVANLRQARTSVKPAESLEKTVKAFYVDCNSK